MNSRQHPYSPTNRSRQVIGAGSVIVILASVLALRLFAFGPGQDGGPTAPAGHVPAPGQIDIRQILVPDWQHRDASNWSIEFKTDLDLLAPLGNGPANAAVWFKDFAKVSGVRRQESRSAMDQRIEHPFLKSVLPGNHPLLLEAEPWCDQATMRFYPDIFSIEGWDTEIPNLVLCLTLARSWVARGLESNDHEAAMEDCRRTIRLGRLLRQDDTTIIADLVGLVCINIGADGIYRLALQEGDTELALVAAVVLGEVAPQRLRTSERITRIEISPYLHRTAPDAITLDLPEEHLDVLVEMVANEPDQRFLGEVFCSLNIVRFHGSEAQQQRVNKLFENLSNSDVPFLAGMARWSNSNAPKQEILDQTMTPLK